MSQGVAVFGMDFEWVASVSGFGEEVCGDEVGE
jgi:hypothetical protein